MEIRVLGPLEVLGDGGASVPLRSWYQRLLLAVLVAGRGRVVQLDELAEALWPTALPHDPPAALQSHVSRLRRRLGRAGEWVESSPSGYCLAAPARRLDRARFEELIDRAAEAEREPDLAEGRLEAALGLWRGRAFAGLEDHPGISPEASRLEGLRVEAAERRAACLLELGRTTEAVGAMLVLTREQPFRERPVAILMEALAADGRHAESLAEFQRFRRLLDDELGLVPSPMLRALEGMVLRHEGTRRRVPGVGVPGNSFVGRDSDMAKTAWLLNQGRLVTVTGPGGVGKTRLALHVAAAASADYPDGVHLCELAEIAEAGDAEAAVASTLGVEERAGRRLVDRIVEVLRPMRALLVLDNCEHLLPAVADVVATILRSTAHVRVLATSRERLGVEGEHRLPLAPLAAPPWDDPWSASAALFADRARAARPDFALAPGDVATISELCRRLDGLPLAIELAATQCAWRTPSEILHDLADRRGGLSDARRTVARHRSLDAVFEWSYDLLGGAEQAAFERLAVFAGGWTPPAAAVVAAASGEIEALVERSLVTVTAAGHGTRYAMLEPLRHYAESRLRAAGGLDGARARHAAWAVGLVETADAGLRGPDEVRWRDALDAELANLRAAHRWSLGRDPDGATRLAASLYRHTWCGAPSELYGWAEAVVDRFADVGHPGIAAAYATAAVGGWHRGDLRRAHALATAGVAAAPGRPEAAQLAFEVLGDVETFLGDFDRARAAFDQAIDLARAVGDDHGAAVALLDRALTHAYQGRVGAALADCSAASPLVAAVANPTLGAWSDYANGEIRLDDDPASALVYLRRSVAAARRIRNRLIVGVAGLSAVSCEARVGDPAKALAQYGQLINHWYREGAWSMQWTTLRTLIELLARLGRDTEAMVLFGALTASATAPPLAGADAARIGDAVAALQRRLGERRAEELAAEGAGMNGEAAVAFARTCVAGHPR